MNDQLIIPRPPRRWLGLVARALLAVLLVPLALAIDTSSGPAGAATEIVLGASASTAIYQQGFGDSGTHPMPDCDSLNIEGRKGYAAWKVESSLGKNSIVFPGTEWDITVTMLADYIDYDPWNYNDGPDPLNLSLVPSGPIERLSVQAELPAPNLGVHDVYQGDDPVGPKQALGTWGYSFDSNSKPKLDGLVTETSDGVDLRLTYKVRATKPGVISLPQLTIDGYDSSPIAGSIGCSLPVDFQWTIVAPDAPVAKPETVKTDARYASATTGDAAGGAHGVVVPVLANDDDPNIFGGPGDPDQVRLASWATTSAHGGTVSCGDPADNHAPKGAAFATLSAGPCTYKPPVGYAGPDTFAYTVRSATDGLEASSSVGITVRGERAPTATPVVFGTATNVDTTFDLASSVGDLDGDPLTCFPAGPAAPAVGTATVKADCSLVWDNTSPAYTGMVSVPYRVCDAHPTLVPPALGAGVTRAAGYSTGTPDDLSATTARRCTQATAGITILPGLILPPTAGTDVDVVDAGYSGDAIGPYTVRIPVLANDTDGNGPKPAVPGVDLEIATAPAANEGVAGVQGDRVTFTPADGYAGPVTFTYRVCEDPAAQNPPYADDPNTFINEGLPWCGVGTVQLDVIGNPAPEVHDDAAEVAHDATIVDLDLGANDTSADGLVCSAGVPAVSNPALVATVSLDGACRLDLDPVDGTGGVVTVTYEACDEHHLADPAHPAVPYGADFRAPGDLAPRCATGTATITIVAPVPPPADDPHEGDPPPVCPADEATTPAGQAVIISVLGNDTDLGQKEQPGPVVLTGPTAKEPATTAHGGQAAMDDPETHIVYQPADGFTGVDTFSYTARDAIGQGCVAQVTVTVTGADPNETTTTTSTTSTTTPAGPTTTAGPTGPGTTDPTGSGSTGSGSNGSGSGSTGSGSTGAGAGGSGSGGATTGTLPTTGSAAGPALGLGLLLIGVGIAVASLGRRTRRAHDGAS